MLQSSFIQELIKFRNSSKLIISICFFNCFLILLLIILNKNSINKLTVTLIGISSSLIGVNISKVDDELELRLKDLQLTSRATSKELFAGYLKDNSIEIEVAKLPISNSDVVEDIVNYWMTQQKHLLLVGGTGDGKSTAIKLFTNSLQDFSIIAYDVDYANGDYSEDIQVLFHYDEIESAFNDDIEDLENRVGVRRIQGKNYKPELQFLIGEEFPALASEVENAGIWIRKISKRGRKVGKFLCVCGQNDTAENFALKGDSAILQSNFVRLYLGKKSIERAKLLKNNELIEWLESTKHGRGLIDDKPCYINANATNSTSLPLPNDELSDSAKIPGSTTRSDSEVNEVDFDIPQIQDFSGEIDTTLLEIAKKLRKEGFTKTAAIKLIFGIDGGSKFSQISKFLN